MPSIVRESGSSTGTLYFYFRNKEDVFAAALEAIGDQIAAALNKAIAAAETCILLPSAPGWQNY